VTRVVLTDDDELFRESLGLNLADEGYDVVSFASGRDTLSYLQDGGAADVLLLDWRMPELNGIDVLRCLRGEGIEVPVIFLTVLSDDIYEQAALEGGAVDFIDKSRRLPILLKRVELIAEARLARQVWQIDVPLHDASFAADAEAAEDGWRRMLAFFEEHVR